MSQATYPAALRVKFRISTNRLGAIPENMQDESFRATAVSAISAAIRKRNIPSLASMAVHPSAKIKNLTS